MAAPSPSHPTNLVYFVHDLNDPAVERRLAMLRPYLASAVIIGFHRAAPAPAELAGWPAINLGRTADGRLISRALNVLRRLMKMRPLRTTLQGATLIVARQLEMLALASAGRQRYAKDAILVYECLDIHRMLLNSRMLRHVESRLLRNVDRVIVSAPGFVDAYLQPAHGAALPPVSLIENKILHSEVQEQSVLPSRPSGPPWRIGWYGVLRCRCSLLLLLTLTRQLAGTVTVELRGRPSLTAIPDFHTLLADSPYITFHGPYDRSTDLARIYGDVHFTWAIDFYEAGQNSAWLLPNRLYEGGAYGAVPIAQAGVATGQWLLRHKAGIVLQAPLQLSLQQFFMALSASSYAAAAMALADVASSSWVDDGQDAEQFIAAIGQGRP